MEKSMHHYQLANNQSWQAIRYKKKIRPKKSSADIPRIRERLKQLGDLDPKQPAHDTTTYDKELVAAIKQFQQRHGLKANGIIDKNTVNALNMQPVIRKEKLKKNILRMDEFLQVKPKSYIQINIPSYELTLVEDNKPVLSMRVIVGQPDWPTPTMMSKLETVVLNPHWNVPESIIEKEIVHEMIKDPDYLDKKNIKIFKSWQHNKDPIPADSVNWEDYTGDKDLPYRLAQIPGKKNALGQIKFTFPNDDNVYMHATPNTALFNLNKRDFSHGCIRLAEPFVLLKHLAKDNKRLTEEKTKDLLESGQTKHFAIKKQLPIFITYFTAWVDNKGLRQFREDIYHKDIPQAKAVPESHELLPVTKKPKQVSFKPGHGARKV